MRLMKLLLALSVSVTVACGTSSSNGLDGSNVDGATQDGGTPQCFMHPTTHIEIINACTNAVAIPKSPVLPLLYSDGGLPPLP
jgi:hypothetical protein